MDFATAMVKYLSVGLEENLTAQDGALRNLQPQALNLAPRTLKLQSLRAFVAPPKSPTSASDCCESAQSNISVLEQNVHALVRHFSTPQFGS